MEDVGFDGLTRVRRYLCESCRRTVSLLPDFALPYLRFSIVLIALFLVARLLEGQTLKRAAAAVAYQRGQFWLRRFRRQAEALCVALAALTIPAPAADFGQLRAHLLAPRRCALGNRRSRCARSVVFGARSG